ncbi:MAG: ribonuclease P protein component [Caldimonas sp.]
MPGRPRPARPLPRLVASADFERVLGLRSRAATLHFAVHHLATQPARCGSVLKRPGAAELSTILSLTSPLPVEDLPAAALLPPNSWVGAVVPKRHARRAVTRSLLKRQIYAAAERHRDRMAPGLWIVRLRAPFDIARFASAASPALRRCARAELDALLGAAVALPSP